MKRSKKEKEKECPKPPPTLVGIILLIQKLGRIQRTRPIKKTINIDLRSLSINDEGAISLIKLMDEQEISCDLLDLSMCGLTNKSAVKIAQWLAHDTQCKTLRLQGNHISDRGGCALAKALQTNCTLTSLRVENNRFHENAGTAFAQALRINTTAFRELHLLANPMGSNGLSQIFLSLGSNRPRVMSIHLRRCDLDCTGVVVLADALRTNETITSVDLRANLISDVGASALASALKTSNRTLRILDLRDNLISQAMYDLSDMIFHNRSVRLLQIEGNPFAGDWDHLRHRISKQMDFNEIGYWKIVEQELKEERDKLAAEEEKRLAAEIEKELLSGGGGGGGGSGGNK